MALFDTYSMQGNVNPHTGGMFTASFSAAPAYPQAPTTQRVACYGYGEQ